VSQFHWPCRIERAGHPAGELNPGFRSSKRRVDGSNGESAYPGRSSCRPQTPHLGRRRPSSSSSWSGAGPRRGWLATVGRCPGADVRVTWRQPIRAASRRLRVSTLHIRAERNVEQAAGCRRPSMGRVLCAASMLRVTVGSRPSVGRSVQGCFRALPSKLRFSSKSGPVQYS
jgi:hypothetical protein